MKKFKKIFFGTYIRGFVFSYFIFLMAGATLLKLPMSIQDGQTLKWIDAIFVSVSGMSTTGLSTIVVMETLTPFGQTILAFILQFGGIGLIMFVAIFWLLSRKRISFRERTMIMTDQNQIGRAGIVGFIRNVLIMILTIELIGFTIMTGYLHFFTDYFETFGEAAFQSFFLTISMFTNAGFDISPGADSLMMYGVNNPLGQDYFMQSLAMILMILGAIGFWPLAEVKQYFGAKRRKEKYEFSLFTKIIVSMHLGLWIVSAIFTYVVEVNGAFAGMGFMDGAFYSLFMSLTTRNAGFATMEMSSFGPTIRAFYGILMFIGSSPNSAGGGIRTTTFLLTFLYIYSFSRGKEQVVIKKRSIKVEALQKSLMVVIGAASLILVALLIMTYTESFSTEKIFFEIASAFGTTGLSLGITSGLTTIGKLTIIVVMFCGRVGILALLLMFRGDKRRGNNIKYPEMDIIVG